MAHITHRRQHKANARERDRYRLEMAAFHRAVRSMSEDVVVLPRDATITLVGQTPNGDEFTAMVQDTEREFSKLLLGQSMTIGVDVAMRGDETGFFTVGLDAGPLGTFSNVFSANPTIDISLEGIKRMATKFRELSSKVPIIREIRVSGHMPPSHWFNDEGVVFMGYDVFEELKKRTQAVPAVASLGVRVYDDRVDSEPPPWPFPLEDMPPWRPGPSIESLLALADPTPKVHDSEV